MRGRNLTHSFQQSPWPERVCSTGTSHNFPFVLVSSRIPPPTHTHRAGCEDKRSEAKEPGGLSRTFPSILGDLIDGGGEAGVRFPTPSPTPPPPSRKWLHFLADTLPFNRPASLPTKQRGHPSPISSEPTCSRLPMWDILRLLGRDAIRNPPPPPLSL